MNWSIQKITHQLTKTITTLTLGAFMIITLFGIFFCTQGMNMMTSNMSMMNQHTTHDCSTMDMNNQCSMTLSEHLALWQSALTSDFNLNVLSFLIGIVVALSIIFSIFTLVFFADSGGITRYRNYLKEHPAIKSYNYLLRIFSRGILQPKLFA